MRPPLRRPLCLNTSQCSRSLSHICSCTNLFAFESYCVRPVGRIDSYPGHPGYIPPASTYVTTPFTALPKATYTAPSVSVDPLAPLASGTRSDCWLFADASELDIDVDLADTFYNSM